jgi:hypothetical protein
MFVFGTEPMILRTGCLKTSARLRDDALDVTRGSGTGDGLAFAPSAALLAWAKSEGRAGRLEEAWPGYRDRFLDEMIVSARENPMAWRRLVERESVTLLCYCQNPLRCHRSLLIPLIRVYANDRPVVVYDGEMVDES